MSILNRLSLGGYWRVVLLLATPIICLPILLWVPDTSDLEDKYTGKENPGVIARAAYVFLIMGIWWISEVIPLAATALFPLLAFPLLTITKAKVVASKFIKDASVLFMGSLVVAVAVEDTNLHRRIALNILRITGSQARWLMLGVMFCTSILSMNMSNTATTAMMVPVVLSVCAELIRIERRSKRSKTAETTLLDAENAPSMPLKGYEGEHGADEDVIMEVEHLSKEELNHTKAMLISTAFASTLGGIGALTGTPPNIIMLGFFDGKFNEHPVNYSNWLIFNAPCMVINVLLTWIWLQILFFGPKSMLKWGPPPKEQADAVAKVLHKELAKLGTISWAEISVFLFLVMSILLWLTRELLGWGYWFTVEENGKLVKYATDGTAIMLAVILLFIWPRHPSTPFQPVVTWKVVEKKLPWGVILLLGGGFAMAHAAQDTGMSKMVASKLATFDVSTFQLSIIVVLMAAILTEFTSNAATTTILLPVILDLSAENCINPVYLSMAACVGCSFAYCFPVATPANAVVFAPGLLTVLDLMIAGTMVNVICICTILFTINTYGVPLFDLDTWPAWAGNATGCMVT